MASDAETRLLKNLFTNYTKATRPVVNDHDAVNLKFGLTINQVIDVVMLNISSSFIYRNFPT